MKKEVCLAKICACGLIPVVRLNDAGAAYQTCLALYNGGIDIIEITMTIPNALKVIENLREKFQDKMVIGAGTILDGETARTAILAGAQFLVGPNLDFSFIEICHRYGIAAMPGALTPTEILNAWSHGADLVKVFPAGLVGGSKYIAAVKEAMPQVRLVGIGKVDLESTVDYIKAGVEAVGVGSALIDQKAITSGQFDLITEKAKQFKQVVTMSRG